MACGTPVLALRAGSVPEIAGNGVSGYVSRTVDDLVRHTRNLNLSPPAIREYVLYSRIVPMLYNNVAIGGLPRPLVTTRAGTFTVELLKQLNERDSTCEDADLISELAKQGPVEIHIVLIPRELTAAESDE